jgi:hypothetical protein
MTMQTFFEAKSGLDTADSGHDSVVIRGATVAQVTAHNLVGNLIARHR